LFGGKFFFLYPSGFRLGLLAGGFFGFGFGFGLGFFPVDLLGLGERFQFLF
jgi:hypothetical protein